VSSLMVCGTSECHVPVYADSRLIYDDDIKARLLRYISSSVLFSESKVDHNVISWNRLVVAS
jgi:hypothetical protein